MKAIINHADLLRLSKELGHPVDAKLATFLGFESSPETLDPTQIKPLGSDQKSQSKVKKGSKTKEKETQKNQSRQPNKAYKYAYLAVNELLKEGIAPVIIKRNTNNTKAPRPTVPALISLLEAREQVQQILQINHAAKSLDIKKAIKVISKNEILEKIPHKQRKRLPDTLCLLLDVSARLEPATPELQQYLQAALQLFGASRLLYCPINYAPNTNGELIFPDGHSLSKFFQENMSVLYIGDQGGFSSSKNTAKQHQHNWQIFRKKCQQANIQTHNIIIAQAEDANSQSVEQLMAATMRCEGPQTDRIRHMRLALETNQKKTGIKKISVAQSLATELLVWNHSDHSNPGQIADVGIKYLHKWAKVYQLIPQHKRKSLENSFEQWRQSLAADTAAMELLKAASLNLEVIEDAQSINQLFSSLQSSSRYPSFIHSRYALLKHILSATKNSPQLKEATRSLSKAIDIEQQAETEKYNKLQIKQQGNKLKFIFDSMVVTNAVTNKNNDYEHSSENSTEQFDKSSAKLIISPQAELISPVLDTDSRIINQSSELSLNQQVIHFESNTHHQQFKQMTRPNWAERIWHDGDGLHAAHEDGTVFQLQPSNNRNQSAQWQASHQQQSNAWHWASDYGIDDYGLWAHLALNNNIHIKLRWIVAGDFIMGSPKEENHRRNDETQHKVTLTKGYWLAETSVTQAQWQLIMGENPSDPKKPELPVNNVSWDNCQIFIKKLQQLVPDLPLQLPTEAQWEYACRAGTETVYWWGDKFDKRKANNSKEIKSESKMPQNLFGLKSMSGNVWEWCSDYYGKYSIELAQNPEGVKSGGLRVLRGGSWIDDARRLRSAARSALSPGIRYVSIGLRLAGGFDPQASNSDGTLTADRRAVAKPVRRQSTIADKIK